MLVHDAAAEQRAAEVPAGNLVAFDLPAEPLAKAIERYSVVSGWQVIYDADLATGRQSGPVKGAYTPAAALRLLLTGTALIAEPMAADGFMLLPDPAAAAAAEAVPSDPASLFPQYYGRIQSDLRRAFCADPHIRGGGAYRIALGLWLGSSGGVTRAVALGSTGRSEIDAAFERAARTLSVGSPPPGFAQPVVILVTPDLIRQCDAAGARSVRAGQ